MEIKVNRKDLVRELNKLQPLLMSRGVNEVFKLINIKTEGLKVVLTAGDNTTYQEQKTSAIIIANGVINVDGLSFVSIIKKLKEDQIILKANDKVLSIIQGRTQLELPLSIATFPVKEELLDNLIELDTDKVSEILAKVVRLTDSDKGVREIFKCVNIVINSGKIKFVATDGHQLIRIIDNVNTDKSYNIILPRRGANQISNIKGQTIKLGVSDNFIQVISEDSYMQIRTVNNNYPDVDKIFPQLGDEIRFDSNRDIIDAIDVVSIAANDLTKVIRLLFDKGSLSISASNITNSNKASSSIDVPYTGEPILIGAVYPRLRSVLSLINEGFSLYLTNNKTPIIIKPDNPNYKIDLLLNPVSLPN